MTSNRVGNAVPAGISTNQAPAASFREEVIDPTTWAGSIPVTHGVEPWLRVGHRWCNLLLLLPLGLVVTLVAVAIAQGLHETEAVTGFIDRFPGTEVTSR